MTSITKRIIGLTSISPLHTSTAILTLILLVVLFQYILNMNADTNSLYQHLFKVSKASLNIQFHIQTMQRMI